MNSEMYILERQGEGIRNAAEVIFGKNLCTAQKYAEHLATSGIERGLLGPRETSRLWDRHILNCAIIHGCIDCGSSVIDIGSGSGLPGLTLAIARPDLEIYLVEPLKRRTVWLEEIVADLNLRNVKIFRCRAEEVNEGLRADVVTARAVLSLAGLIKISLPLLRKDSGTAGEVGFNGPIEGKHPKILAIKGLAVAEELKGAQKILCSNNLKADVRILGEDILKIPTRVVEISK